MTVQEILTEDAARELLELDDDDLHQLLGARVMALQKDPGLSLQSSFGLDTDNLEALRVPRWLEKTVDEMIKTAFRQTYNVVCSNDPDFKQLRD